MDEIIKEGGAMERYSESDWIMGSTIEWDQVPTIKPTIYHYNQDEFYNNTCTVYASMKSWSAVTGQEISKEKREEIVEEAIRRGLDTSIGWRVNMAVKLVYDMMGEVSYVSTAVGSEDYYEALRRGYLLVNGYNGNRTYNTDRDNDYIVQTNDWGRTSYGHCISHGPKTGSDITIYDNYPSRKTNVYYLPELEEKQKKAGQIFYNAYFYIPKITVPMANLPKHNTTFSTPLRMEVLKARQTELSLHIDKGGTPIYSVYYSDNPADEVDIISKMQTELALLRKGLSK